MKFIRWMITLIACLSLMIACSAPESTEQNDDAEEQTLKEGTSNTEEEKEKKRKEKRERQKEEEVAEVNNEDIALFEVNDIEDLKIQEKKVDNLYDDEGNFPAHTEKEIFRDFADDDGWIEFELDDQPVRNITSEDGKINNITNYSDHFIDITSDVALVYPEEHIEALYNIVISQPADFIEGYDGDGNIPFRTFDEITSLERAILASIGMTGPLLNVLDEMIMEDSIDEETYEVIIEQFDKLGSPTVLIPAPQNLTDYELFNIMLIVKDSWMQLASYEDMHEDYDSFVETYTGLREMTNNLFAYLYVTIGEIE
ncbi:MAG TPA: hypothetical protein VK029_04725 [Pseudogracilibacillus sp.]|nr:hypothetical protein [Pseudogracilibacillus sp.]